MNKYKKYYGLGIFIAVLLVAAFLAYIVIMPSLNDLTTAKATLNTKTEELEKKENEKKIVLDKIKKLQDSLSSSQKKIYSPTESDLGNETLFFTLYKDVIEILHTNSVRIKSIDYTTNPDSDTFVQFGKDVYFVCDLNLQLVSNYVNLGKLIQDIYQYPYYIKINSIDVRPYEKDKKVLLTDMNLRLYAHTTPTEETNDNTLLDENLGE